MKIQLKAKSDVSTFIAKSRKLAFFWIIILHIAKGLMFPFPI